MFLTQKYRIEEKGFQLISFHNISDDTISATDKTEMVLNDPIGGSEMYNNN